MSERLYLSNPLNPAGGFVSAMKTYAVTQPESSVITSESHHDGIAAYVGISVLVYVLVLFMFAPRQNPLNRRKSSL
ncbi:MAG: hypothetical protein AAGI69_28065 [Cyanobacteria bacterium P01_H01_bin.21]